LEKLKDILPLIKKYRYAALILAFGLVLMLLPVGADKKEPAQAVPAATEPSLALQMEVLLSQIQGVGKVSVMLTSASGEETLYQTNGSEETDTVIVSDSQRNEMGLIRQINPPRYMGAVVICQGGDLPGVRLAVVDAVSKLNGLGADRISVLKMK
jgi:stage III sporulation protein AG